MATNMHLHFLSRCFHAPRILCWGTEPPSSTLLFHFFLTFVFFVSYRPTDRKSENAFDDEQRKKGDILILVLERNDNRWLVFRRI